MINRDASVRFFPSFPLLNFYFSRSQGWCQDSILDLASLFCHLMRRNVEVFIAHQAAAYSPAEKRPSVEVAFPGLPGTRLVGDRGFLEGLLKATSGAHMLRKRRDERERGSGEGPLRKSGQGNGGVGYHTQEVRFPAFFRRSLMAKPSRSNGCSAADAGFEICQSFEKEKDIPSLVAGVVA